MYIIFTCVRPSNAMSLWRVRMYRMPSDHRARTTVVCSHLGRSLRERRPSHPAASRNARAKRV